MTDVAAIAVMTTSTRNITRDSESVRAAKTHCDDLCRRVFYYTARAVQVLNYYYNIISKVA